MNTALRLFLVQLCVTLTCFSQGHIDHIKKQPYMKLASNLDCNNLPGDNLSERICANLAFQKSDSLLCVIYNGLMARAADSYVDSLKQKLVNMQITWRSFRDQHCAIIFNKYEGCGGCHQRAIDYLNCLTELTYHRIDELKKLAAEVGVEVK